LDHWRKELRSDKFASGPVNSLKEAFNHEQVEHLGLVKSLVHPTYGEVKVVGPAVTFSEMRNEATTAPPMLGEHTREILSEQLGLEDEELGELKKHGAIDY
jgi:succinate--hydroxymethylglutarate CoA-transferase